MKVFTVIIHTAVNVCVNKISWKYRTHKHRDPARDISEVVSNWAHLPQIMLVTWSAPSHYLNQCWIRNKFQWNRNQITTLFMQESELESVRANKHRDPAHDIPEVISNWSQLVQIWIHTYWSCGLMHIYPDSKIHRTHMGPIWGR